MAVVKKEAAIVATETEVGLEPETAEKDLVEKEEATNTAAEREGFCVYIGPSIRGVIQSGTVYSGTREQTLNSLSDAVKRYPLIAPLIVTNKTFAEDRIKVKTAGNLLNVQYKKLATGKKEEY